MRDASLSFDSTVDTICSIESSVTEASGEIKAEICAKDSSSDVHLSAASCDGRAPLCILIVIRSIAAMISETVLMQR